MTWANVVSVLSVIGVLWLIFGGDEAEPQTSEMVPAPASQEAAGAKQTDLKKAA